MFANPPPLILKTSLTHSFVHFLLWSIMTFKYFYWTHFKADTWISHTKHRLGTTIIKTTILIINVHCNCNISVHCITLNALFVSIWWIFFSFSSLCRLQSCEHLILIRNKSLKRHLCVNFQTCSFLNALKLSFLSLDLWLHLTTLVCCLQDLWDQVFQLWDQE